VIDPIETAKQFECDKIIIATGPLTTDHLSAWIKENLAPDDFYFYDAIAPVVDAESLNYDKLYFKDRYKDDATEADYLNAPFSKIEYEQFVKAMVEAQKVPRQHFEQERFFEACLPVDLMAERGVDTPRFSCMKPVGLEQDKKNPPYAVVQLRKENLLGSAFNLVGFQNRLTYSEQVRVFKMIPGFENASFLHLGSVHRNSFLNAKKLLNQDLSSKKYPHLFFAGQMTGVEGYTESASMGQYVAWNMVEQFKLKEFRPWPVETAIGALINYLMTSDKPSPSNINFGLLPPVTLTKEQRKNKKRKSIKKMLVAEKAQKIFDQFLEGR